MLYKDVTVIAREEAVTAFDSTDIAELCNAMVSVAFYEKDWHWAQDRFLSFINHDEPQVRGLAAICLGHLARIHGVLDLDLVLPILHELRHDSAISGRVEDALDDITQYANRNSR